MTKILLLLCVTWCVCVPGFGKSISHVPCEKYHCDYSCDTISKVLQRNADNKSEDISFVNHELANLSAQPSSVNIHRISDACTCDQLLETLNLSSRLLQSDDSGQHCVVIRGDLHNDIPAVSDSVEVDGETPRIFEGPEKYMDTVDGVLVILGLVVAAFIVWLLLMFGVYLYAHILGVEREKEESKDLIGYEAVPIASKPAEPNTRPTRSVAGKSQDMYKDVADVSLYSNLPLVR